MSEGGEVSPKVAPRVPQSTAEDEAERRGEARDGTFAAGAPAPPNVASDNLTASFSAYTPITWAFVNPR